MSDSDDDIGPGWSYSYHYTYRYAMSDAFIAFFGLDKETAHHRYNNTQLERIIVRYVESHNGMNDDTDDSKAFHYDEALWNLFDIPATEPFKLRHLYNRIQKCINLVRPCPICEKPSPFEYSCPNRVCKECIPALFKKKCAKNIGLNVALNDDLVEKILADMATPYTEPLEIIINRIKCKQDYNSVIKAIVHCPLCHVEVNEERRLGAFCDDCVRSEEIVDANGDRVRFKTTSSYDNEDLSYCYDTHDGFCVLFYKKCSGEIVKQFHQGEFPCFFRGIECVAEDTGVHNRIIVRFRNKDTKRWDADKDHIRIPAFQRDTQPTQKQADTLTLPSDWMYCSALF